LDVTCFKPFKTTLRKELDVAMAKNNFLELDKITLAKWVDKVLQQFIKK
jgi:ATP-dependent Clp protease adapter protein ClpS